MASEEQNKKTDWTARLDAMDHFNGEPGLDKASSWEKIRQRLYGKGKSKKLIAYWTAAACAGLIIFLLTMRSDKRTLAPRESVPAIHSVAVETPPVNTRLETESRVIISGKKKIKGVSPNKKLVKRNVNLESGVEAEPTSIAGLEIPPQPHMEMNVDSSTKSTTTVIIQKKLPVVHINELEENENMEEQMVTLQRTKDSKSRIKKDRKSTKRALAISGSSSGHLIIEISLNN